MPRQGSADSEEQQLSSTKHPIKLAHTYPVVGAASHGGSRPSIATSKSKATGEEKSWIAKRALNETQEELLSEAIAGDLLHTLDAHSPKVVLRYNGYIDEGKRQSDQAALKKLNDQRKKAEADLQEDYLWGVDQFDPIKVRISERVVLGFKKSEAQLEAKIRQNSPVVLLSRIHEDARGLASYVDQRDGEDTTQLQGLPGFTRAVVLSALLGDRPDDIKLDNMLWNTQLGEVQRIDTAFFRGNVWKCRDFEPRELMPGGRHDVTTRMGMMQLISDANVSGRRSHGADTRFLHHHLPDDAAVYEEAMGALQTLASLSDEVIESTVDRMTKFRLHHRDGRRHKDVDLANDTFRQQHCEMLKHARGHAQQLMEAHQVAHEKEERGKATLPGKHIPFGNEGAQWNVTMNDQTGAIDIVVDGIEGYSTRRALSRALQKQCDGATVTADPRTYKGDTTGRHCVRISIPSIGVARRPDVDKAEKAIELLEGLSQGTE